MNQLRPIVTVFILVRQHDSVTQHDCVDGCAALSAAF
jgi:hypothetical protein